MKEPVVPGITVVTTVRVAPAQPLLFLLKASLNLKTGQVYVCSPGVSTRVSTPNGQKQAIFATRRRLATVRRSREERGEWKDFRENLPLGRPLIVSLQPEKNKGPYHYVVVTGMDFEREAVFVNDPARGKLVRIERADFEKEWQAVGNWMLLAVPSQPAPAE